VMNLKRRMWVAMRGAGFAGVTLGLAACAMPDMSQLQMPRVDWSSFVPANQNQYLGQTRDRSIRPDDLVDGSGRCAGAPVGAGGEQAAPPASAPTPAIRGVGLEMTECDVVRAAGAPESVQISTSERGERSVTMIYGTPERPSYHFIAGRLVSIERGAEPPPEPARKKAPAKKQAKKQQAT